MSEADALKADYLDLVEEDGELILIRRYTGAGLNRPRFDAEIRAVVSGYQPAELVGGIVQGDRRVIVLAQDMIDNGFPLNLTRVSGATDMVVIRGRECAIIAADDNTRRVLGTLIAYDLQVRG